jgi:hypothetical protein
MKVFTEKEVEELLQTQKGNCYVAILSETKDETIASLATSAPEPGQWRERKNGTTKEFDNVVETLDELSKFLDERVSDLYQVQGGMQARHCYIFYRSKVWEAMFKIRDILRS